MTAFKAFETVYSKPTRIDRDKGILFGCKLLGRYSKNGREYSPKAQAQAAELYKTLGIDLDHHKDKRTERSVRDLIAIRPQNVQVKEDGVYGDIHLLLTDPNTPKLLEAAERDPAVFGFSHEADLTGSKRNKGIFVESVDKVYSLDLVRHPATTLGAFESMDESHITEATTAQPAAPEAGESCKDLIARAMVAAEKEGDTDLATKLHKLLKPEKQEDTTPQDSTDDAAPAKESVQEIKEIKKGMTPEDIEHLGKHFKIPSDTTKMLSKYLSNTSALEVIAVFESIQPKPEKRRVGPVEQPNMEDMAKEIKDAKQPTTNRFIKYMS